MRAYLWITGGAFAVMTVVHLWRMAVEKSVLGEPAFLGITVVAAMLSIWAFRLLRSANRPVGGSDARGLG